MTRINADFVRTFAVERRCYQYNKYKRFRKLVFTLLYPMLFNPWSMTVRGWGSGLLRLLVGCKEPATYVCSWGPGGGSWALYCSRHALEYVEEGHGEWNTGEYHIERLHDDD